MPQLQSPVGLLGIYLPESQDDSWGEYVNSYCKIIEATFFSKEDAELEVEFLKDGKILTIQLNEFSLL